MGIKKEGEKGERKERREDGKGKKQRVRYARSFQKSVLMISAYSNVL